MTAPAPSPAVEPPHDLRAELVDCLRLWDSDRAERIAEVLLTGRPLAPLLDRLTRAEAAVRTVLALHATDCTACATGPCMTVQALTAALAPESVQS